MLLGLLEVCEKHFVHLHGEFEAYLQELGSQVRWQSAVSLQVQLKLNAVYYIERGIELPSCRCAEG